MKIPERRRISAVSRIVRRPDKIWTEEDPDTHNESISKTFLEGQWGKVLDKLVTKRLVYDLEKFDIPALSWLHRNLKMKKFVTNSFGERQVSGGTTMQTSEWECLQCISLCGESLCGIDFFNEKKQSCKTQFPGSGCDINFCRRPKSYGGMGNQRWDCGVYLWWIKHYWIVKPSVNQWLS